jgi:hypothetical protein
MMSLAERGILVEKSLIVRGRYVDRTFIPDWESPPIPKFPGKTGAFFAQPKKSSEKQGNFD